MTFEQIRVNNYLGVYNSDDIPNKPLFNEDIHTKEEDKDSKVVSITQATGFQKGESGFRLDLREAIMNEGNLNEHQAHVVLTHAWEIGYDESYQAIIIVAKAYTAIAREISRLK